MPCDRKKTAGKTILKAPESPEKHPCYFGFSVNA
jgi:hypothetical protein